MENQPLNVKDQFSNSQPVVNDHQPKDLHEERKGPSLTLFKSLVFSSILILLVGGSAILLGRNKQKPVDWIYVNAINKKQKVDLPDGSTVMLKKGSSLSYQTDFGKANRMIIFKGEGSFDVLYNPSIPFSVKAINEITSETGTSFIIRCNDSVEQVIVSEGIIKLHNSKNKAEVLVLTAGQKAETKGNKIVQVPVNKGENHFWSEEKIVFDHVSLQQVTEDLNFYYEVPIAIDSEIKSEGIFVTAQFENQPVDRILNEIGIKTGLTIQKEGDTFFFTKPHPVDPVSKSGNIGILSKKKKKKKNFWKFLIK